MDAKKATTNDITLADEYQIQRLNALPLDLRDLAARHVLDQFEAVPSYLQRFQSPRPGEEQTHA